DTIRSITPLDTNWVVRTIAPIGANAGRAVAVDGNGNIYAPDVNGSRILKIALSGTTNHVVSTIGGGAPGMGSADGAGSAALFSSPHGIGVDAQGNVYVADTGNNTIRKGTFTAYTPTNPVPYTHPPMTAQLTMTL